MTTQTVADKLLAVVQGAIGNTALTADALGKFADLQKQFDAISKEKTQYEEWWKGKNAELARANDLIEKLTTENNTLRTKIEKAEALEFQSKMDIFEKNFYKSRGDEMRGILSDIFRNITVNRTMNEHVVLPPGIPNQYNNYPTPGITTPVQNSSSETAG